MLWLLVKYILTAAFKDKILLSFLIVIGVGVSLSIFLGSSSVTEKDQASIVFTASMLRFSGIITLTLFAVFYIRKAFDTRDVEFMLARPITRSQYLAGYYLAFFFLAVIVTFLMSLTLFLMPEAGNIAGILLWSASLLVELMIMVSVAIFFSFVISSAVSAALITFAFYALSRMIGGILGVVQNNTSESAMILMERIMLIISVFIPRLDLLGQGSWLIYDQNTSVGWPFILGQGIVFIGLVFFAALIDFRRKQF